MIGLLEEHQVSLKKLVAEKVVDELGQRSEKTESSSKFVDVFVVDYSAHRQEVIRKLKGTLL